MMLESKPCPRCGLTTLIEVPVEGYQLWQQGALIQNAFPRLSIEDRETLLTGYHSQCFDADFLEE